MKPLYFGALCPSPSLILPRGLNRYDVPGHREAVAELEQAPGADALGLVIVTKPQTKRGGGHEAVPVSEGMLQAPGENVDVQEVAVDVEGLPGGQLQPRSPLACRGPAGTRPSGAWASMDSPLTEQGILACIGRLQFLGLCRALAFDTCDNLFLATSTIQAGAPAPAPFLDKAV